MNKLKTEYNSEKIDDFIENNENIKNSKNLKEKISCTSEKKIDKKKIIFDTPVDITIELGRSKIKIKELLNFSKGSMFFLNHHQDDPLKIFANGKLIGFGEIVVSDNKYGVKIISIKNSLNNIN